MGILEEIHLKKGHLLKISVDIIGQGHRLITVFAASEEGINSVLIITAEKRSEYISIWIEGTRLGVIFELSIENETVILKIIVAYKPDRRIICRAEEIEEIQRENVFVAGAEQWLERVSFRDKYQICQEWLA